MFAGSRSECQSQRLNVCVGGGWQVSTGVTLRENNLKQIEGGKIIESQGVLVANRRSLQEDPRLLAIVRELIERFEACLASPRSLEPGCAQAGVAAH